MKKGMMYKEMYEGKFYGILIGSPKGIKEVDINCLTFDEVPVSELRVDREYLNENGSTVRYMGNKSYEVLDRTPLYGADKVTNLSNENQVRLFWVLKNNCKNGTYRGI